MFSSFLKYISISTHKHFWKVPISPEGLDDSDETNANI